MIPLATTMAGTINLFIDSSHCRDVEDKALRRFAPSLRAIHVLYSVIGNSTKRLSSHWVNCVIECGEAEDDTADVSRISAMTARRRGNAVRNRHVRIIVT
jgi:hypothetical protein